MSGVIAHVLRSGKARAIGAAVKSALRFDAMTDDLALAMIANGREFMNRALKAIKDVLNARRDNFKRQVVIVAAYLTLSHFVAP
jgi:hypothetical protein